MFNFSSKPWDTSVKAGSFWRSSTAFDRTFERTYGDEDSTYLLVLNEHRNGNGLWNVLIDSGKGQKYTEYTDEFLVTWFVLILDKQE